MWGNIVKIKYNLDNLEFDMKSFFYHKIGIGSDTLFWFDHWVDSDSLSNGFSLQFKLDKQNLPSFPI